MNVARKILRTAWPIALAAVLAGCYSLRPSSGGGQTRFDAPRTPSAADVLVPAGYRVELVAQGLTFPTGIAFDDAARPHVIEAGYSYGEVFTEPRLLRLAPDGTHAIVARGQRNGPWTGIAFAQGAFFVAEGGVLEGGRILRIVPGGSIDALVRDLPSVGDHHTNGPAIGPDGALYFGIGTATNAGVVGPDNAKFGWLKRWPRFHDVPCRDIRLAGVNFESENPLGAGRVTTGAFLPFGTPSTPGQTVTGRVPCSGAVLRIRPAGGAPELVAWGFRNPFGLAFAPDGALYVTDNGYDDRGSRPVWGTGDLLWRVERGQWYGWPDHSGDHALHDKAFRPPGRDVPQRVLAESPGKPPEPAAVLGVHSSSNGFDFSRNAAFGHVGQAFVAQFGDQAGSTGKVLAPVGFKVVRVDPRTGTIEDFAVNRGPANGPASKIGTHGLERPVAARFDPAGTALYVVDFGVLLETPDGTVPKAGTGAVWRITRSGR